MIWITTVADQDEDRVTTQQVTSPLEQASTAAVATAAVAFQFNVPFSVSHGNCSHARPGPGTPKSTAGTPSS